MILKHPIINPGGSYLKSLEQVNSKMLNKRHADACQKVFNSITNNPSHRLYHLLQLNIYPNTNWDERVVQKHKQIVLRTLLYRLQVPNLNSLSFHQLSGYLLLHSFSLGNPVNELLLAVLVSLFLLIVPCPNITEFWVPSTMRYVALSFWPFAPHNWLKWFSTLSWLIIASLMNAPGKRATFNFIMDMKPRIEDCWSNHDLSLKNSLCEEVLDFQFLK